MDMQQFVPPMAFGYDTLPTDKVATLREQAATIRMLVKTTTASIIEIGRHLVAVQDSLEHGQFTHWVEIECGFTVRTAQNYIRVATLAGKSETVSLLPPTTAYKLASKSAAPEVVKEVLARAESGTIISDSGVKEMLAEAAHQRRQAAREEQEALKRSKSKRKRERLAIEKRQHEEQAQKQAAADKAAAQSIISRIGADGAAFLLDVLAAHAWWDVEGHLRNELGNTASEDAA